MDSRRQSAARIEAVMTVLQELVPGGQTHPESLQWGFYPVSLLASYYGVNNLPKKSPGFISLPFPCKYPTAAGCHSRLVVFENGPL